MRTTSLVSGILALVLLAVACGDGKPPAPQDGHEIRPRFTVGDRYRVRVSDDDDVVGLWRR
jgi:hypothetical protein